MVKENLLERIRKIKSGQTEQKSGKEVRHLTRQSFSDSIRQKCARSHSALKRLLTFTAIVVLSSSQAREAVPATLDGYADTRNRIEITESCRQQSIHKIVNAQTTQLQNQILSNISTLQENIKAAKRSGRRNQTVKKIFDTVYKRGGLLGSMNYCVAGAMLAQMQCQDNVLNEILPDPSKTAKDYKFSGHPNVSCPYMREFFQQTLGDNYAERGDKNFKDFVKTLEAGDIITVSSSANTSSGEHCVTCAGPVVNGRVPVKSLNGESNYEVAVTSIVGAAKVMEQYRDVLTQKLEKEISIDDYMLLAAEGEITLTNRTASKHPELASGEVGKNTISPSQLNLMQKHSVENS